MAPTRFAHVPAVLGPDHQKLSKRRGARNVLEYGELGYLPSAIVNAIALLGWSSGDEQEVFTPEELVERFTLDRVNAAAAIFDPKRLDDLNGIHIRRLTTDELVEALEFPLPGTSKETRRLLIPMLRERMVTLADATRLCKPLLGEVTIDPSVDFPPKNVDQATAVAIIDECISAIEDGALENHDVLLERIRAVGDAAGVKARDSFRVLYVAILGVPAGLPVIEAMMFLGKDPSLRRLREARARLG
jgi:glutamyl-tRNA synthetase